MEKRSSNRVRCIVLLCVVFTVCGVVYLGYFCPERVCALTAAAARSGGSLSQNSASSQRFRLDGDASSKQSRKNSADHNDDFPNELRDPVADQFAVKSHKLSRDNLHGNNDADQTSDVQPLKKPQWADQPNSDEFPPAYYSAEKAADAHTYSSLSAGADATVAAKNVGVSYDDVTNSTGHRFDVDGRDVIVFLHIQKTGGTTFGRHLVHDLDLAKPCECRRRGKTKRKRCRCIRPNSNTSNWLFSRFSTGWQCGLHADWTELTSCVDTALNKEEGNTMKRRYFYVTLLRDPLVRFLSEFLHVQRGATWKTSRHWCGGREATSQELPPCYEGDNWEDVSLEEFMACPSNLAINRQTRMLADLTVIDCYNATAMSAAQRDALMLASAKENLRRLAYFGLCEQQQMAQYMFEETFRMNFLTTFQQFNETHVTSVLDDVTPRQLRALGQLNYLDVQLYAFAQDLLRDRFDRLRARDPDFEAHYQGLGRPPAKYFQWEEGDSN